MIKPFDLELNKQLRDMYLTCLNTPIKRPDGTMKHRASGLKFWESIPQEPDVMDITSIPDYMKNVWIWSDIHFGHTNVIRYSNRPYKDASHMDESLITSFNSKVKPNDISIWVGDVSFSGEQRTKQIVHRLNGYKILIVGNHDIEKKRRIKPMAFDEVHLCYNLMLDDMPLAFTHYPMDNLPPFWFNIHGHVHKNGHRIDEVITKAHYNVNCEFLDYTPINLETLIERIKNVNANP
jgi:calcineurin-like phosphoesterase family protein